MENIKKDPYSELGVSSKKEGVHKATKNISKGLYPGAFCKIIPIFGLPGEIAENYVQVIHSDGVGTKSNVAYIARREGYGSNIYQTLPQDALVMNTDDMACVGIINDICVSNHIARNANRVNDEDISEIINGYEEFYNLMRKYGINIIGAGGETADVGSYTTTVGIDVTAVANLKEENVIDADNISEGSVIVALASYGKCDYEKNYNSGIRSNGLTLAINSLLNPKYRKYTEVMDSTIDSNLLFSGKYMLDDIIKGNEFVADMTVREAILSPTRTFLPALKLIKQLDISGIQGIIHCSGGGLTKSVNFGKGIRYIKDNLLPIPPIFSEIQEIRNIDDEYMFQTFNMGHGMEIIVSNIEDANAIIHAASIYGIDAKIIGYTEKAETNEVIIKNNGKTLSYKR